MRYDAIIVGGGAAGLAAGVSLARAGWNTAVLEAQPRVGRKLLSTGSRPGSASAPAAARPEAPPPTISTSYIRRFLPSTFQFPRPYKHFPDTAPPGAIQNRRFLMRRRPA